MAFTKKTSPDPQLNSLVLCDADGGVIRYVPEPDGGRRPFRFKDDDGRLYEHNGEDSMGRWTYVAVR
jgi:hypothetical protein